MPKNGAATVLEEEATKSAFTDREAVIVTVHVMAVPLHAPDHPLNTYPLVGTAVKVTDVPWVKFDAHWLGHWIPGGLLETLPVPLAPVVVTNRG
jgi:hypothetical protein